MADISTDVVAALTTVFTPPPECANRYAVFIASPTPIGGTSTNPPSSGWIDPSFTKCNPPQYTNTYPTFSPGVCPKQMSIVSSTSNVDSGKTRWTGACCQSGFSTAEVDPQWICTSSVTTPMPFLLDPNISTADIYTTLSNIWIEHDQVTVQWEEKDLEMFPSSVATHYASIMGKYPAPHNTGAGSLAPGTPVTPVPTSPPPMGTASSTDAKMTATPSATPANLPSVSNPSSLTTRTESSNGSAGARPLRFRWKRS
ncbi:xylose isomerase-like protein [Apiospora arundinis]